MIAGHLRDAYRRQQALTVQRAAVQEHLQQTQIVGHGADQAGRALLERRVLGNRDVHVGLLAQRSAFAGCLIDPRQTVHLLRRNEECRVRHAQRCQHLVPQVNVERLARDDLDDAPEHGGGFAVDPHAARVAHQWHGRHFFHELLERVGAGAHCAALIQRAVAMTQATDVEQQVADGGRTGGRAQRTVVRVIGIHEYLHVGEAWNIAGHRVLKRQASLFHQLHDGQ